MQHRLIPEESRRVFSQGFNAAPMFQKGLSRRVAYKPGTMMKRLPHSIGGIYAAAALSPRLQLSLSPSEVQRIALPALPSPSVQTPRW